MDIDPGALVALIVIATIFAAAYVFDGPGRYTVLRRPLPRHRRTSDG